MSKNSHIYGLYKGFLDKVFYKVF